MSESDLPPAVDLPTATEAWLSVVRAYNECTTTLSQRVAPLGLTLLQHEVLMNLLRTSGLTQQALAARCFSAKSGVSMLVSGFVQDGVIARSRAPDDQRAWNLTLTAKGRALAEQAAACQTQVVAEMTKDLSAQELAMIQSIMAQGAERLKAMRTSG